MFFRRRIYLDYASATPVLPEAVAAMREAEKFTSNPGAIHAEGVAAKTSLENSRAKVGALLGCKARELVFTSGLTEANNLAILGFAKYMETLARPGLAARQGRALMRTHWVVSSIEHDSVLECFSEIERLGGNVSHVDPNEHGRITPEVVARALRPETVFVSIGWANSEIGVAQPLSKISRVIRTHGDALRRHVVFHSDAGQAPLYLGTLAHSLGVDLLSLGSNKLYGPHGIGALYVGNKAGLAPLSLGGKQERGSRAGTESVALAAGFSAALAVVVGERKAEAARLEKLRGELARELAARIPGLIVNGSTSRTTGGDLEHVLPHILNVSIPGEKSGEYLALQLDHAGIALSTKSACDEGNKSSHVVLRLAEALAKAAHAPIEEGRAENTLRFSLGRSTTSRDLARALSALVELCVRQGRTLP